MGPRAINILLPGKVREGLATLEASFSYINFPHDTEVRVRREAVSWGAESLSAGGSKGGDSYVFPHSLTSK